MVDRNTKIFISLSISVLLSLVGFYFYKDISKTPTLISSSSSIAVYSSESLLDKPKEVCPQKIQEWKYFGGVLYKLMYEANEVYVQNDQPSEIVAECDLDMEVVYVNDVIE